MIFKDLLKEQRILKIEKLPKKFIIMKIIQNIKKNNKQIIFLMDLLNKLDKKIKLIYMMKLMDKSFIQIEKKVIIW